MKHSSFTDKIFNKLRKLEYHFLITIKSIEEIRINILLTKKEEISKKLLKIFEKEDLLIINKTSAKIKKKEITKKLRKAELKSVLEQIHFPSKKILSISKNILDKKEYNALKTITEDEKKAIELITAMHYPLILKMVNQKIKQNPFFIKYEHDLIGEGFIGLTEAIYKFDLSKKVKFITYATPWINYRIKNFIENILVEIDSQNGNHKIYLFDDKVFINETEEAFEDFKRKIYSYDFPLPLGYLFPKLKLDKPSILKSNLNIILNNHFYTKKALDFIKNIPEFEEIINQYKDKPQLALRLILQELFPNLVKIKLTQHSKEENKENTFELVSVQEDPLKKEEEQQMLTIILKEANEEEKALIKKFLNEELHFEELAPIISNIKERLKKKKII